MSDPAVLTSVDDGVMLVTLNRPDAMNTMDLEMLQLLVEALAEANEREDVNALVLTGAGDAFCAGAEIGEGGRLTVATFVRTREERLDRRGWSTRVAVAFSESDVPVIGAINGMAAGGGFSLALCCDIRFLGEGARMGSIFIKRGLASDFGAAYRLQQIVGLGRAHELLYDGDPVSAERCLELGLANRVVPDDQLLDEALAYARKIASGPPLAYTAMRRLLQRSTELPMIHYLEYEWTAQLGLFASRDTREGFRAFAERREPRFEGL
ncbi:MAG: enoyl-CoA hydratase/isomerase family protein [Chloroflexi bacterium]|nr:enoyl-CoA hydratase/isomerase family protein [Chloroflexota bacterium]